MNSDNGVFGEDYQPSREEEFVHAAEAAMIGYYIGNQLDRTRFGRWYNRNPVVNVTYTLAVWAIIGWFSWAALWFLYMVICLVLS